MTKSKRKLSTFETCYMWGCGVGFFGMTLSDPIMIWTGLSLFALGAIFSVIEIIKKNNRTETV